MITLLYRDKLESIIELFSSKRNEDGNVQAGTHLIIMDDSSCQETISKSNPVILNYYRQFLLKGFDWRYFKILRNLDDLYACLNRLKVISLI